MSLVYNFKLALQKSDFLFNGFKIAGKQIIQCDLCVNKYFNLIGYTI